jgi:hypothetical protein
MYRRRRVHATHQLTHKYITKVRQEPVIIGREPYGFHNHASLLELMFELLRVLGEPEVVLRVQQKVAHVSGLHVGYGRGRDVHVRVVSEGW